MSINISLANSQANRLNEYAQDAGNIKNNTTKAQAALNSSYCSDEIGYITQNCSNEASELAAIASLLVSLGSEIRSVANEIASEEAAAAAAAAAAKAAAAKRFGFGL